MGRYQEKSHWSDYKQNRKRVCEVYGVDPNKAQVHHIVDRYTALHDPVFADMDINEPSNLYPFTDDKRGREQHTTKQDHEDLHYKIGKREHDKRNGWQQGDAERNWKPKPKNRGRRRRR